MGEAYRLSSGDLPWGWAWRCAREYAGTGLAARHLCCPDLSGDRCLCYPPGCEDPGRRCALTHRHLRGESLMSRYPAPVPSAAAATPTAVSGGSSMEFAEVAEGVGKGVDAAGVTVMVLGGL